MFSRFAAAIVLAVSLAGAVSADPYTVRGVAVDKTAGSINQAITEGRAGARVEAARRLIDRLTLPEDRAAATQPIDPAEVARMMRSYDFDEEERRTATRYITVMSVNFLASEVRDYLDRRNVPFVESQAGAAMITPVASGGLDPVAWSRAWGAEGDNTVLTPYVVSEEAWDRPPAWEQVETEIVRRNEAAREEAMRLNRSSPQDVQRAIVAGIYMQDGQLYVRLSELRGGNPETTLALAGPFNDYDTAKTGSIAALERAWKTASVVRTTGSTPMSLVARFNDLNQWVTIRKGMETSRLINNLKIESVSASGADISFVFAGRPDQLASDLRSKGVALRSGDRGWVVEASSQQ